METMDEIRRARVGDGTVAVWWLGQSGYAVKTPGGVTALVDPYLSDSRSDGGHHDRLFPPPIAPAEVRCDIVLCTHDHSDHTDPATLLPIVAHTEAIIAAPGSCCARLARLGVPAARLHRLDIGKTFVYGDFTVAASFALHGHPGPANRLPRHPVTDPIGLLVGCGPVRLYHTGDTLDDPRLRDAAAFKPQTIFICINGSGGNMNAEEAARLTADLAPAVAIPMHYGCIPVNNADPQPFIEAVRATAARTRVVLLETSRRYDIREGSGFGV